MQWATFMKIISGNIPTISAFDCHRCNTLFKYTTCGMYYSFCLRHFNLPEWYTNLSMGGQHSFLTYSCMNFQINFLCFHRTSNIHVRDERQETPLHCAVCFGEIAAVRILLDNNADMQLKNYFGDQPIHKAARASDHKYVDVQYLKPPLFLSNNNC